MADAPDHPPEKPPNDNSPPGSRNPTTKSDGFPAHKHAKVMENTIAFVLKCAAQNSPTKTLTQKQKALIQQRLLHSFPVFHRPDHPPYAAMIEAALEKLNQKGGSSEKALSNFIKKYVDLPWAHDIFLKHHLENLCKEGRIFKTRTCLYKLSDKVSNDVDPPTLGSPIGTDSDLSADLDPDCSSHYDTDCSVRQIPAQNRKRLRRKLLKRRVRSNNGRKKGKKHKRVNNEMGQFLKWQTEEDVVDDEMTLRAYTSMVNRRREGNGEHTQTENECNRLHEVTRFRAKRQNTKKPCPGELAIQISSYGHEYTVNNNLNGQRVQGHSTGRDDSKVEVQDCHSGAKAKQSVSLPMQHKVASTPQLSREAETQEEQHNMIEVTGPKENPLKETYFQAVEKENQMQVQNAVQVGEKCSVQKRRGGMHNGSSKGQEVPKVVEEAEQLQEHNSVPVGEQCRVQKKRGQLPYGSKKGQKVSVKHVRIPGRLRGRPRENDSWVHKMNSEQTQLTKVLDSVTFEHSKILETKCQKAKNLRVGIEGQAEDTPHEGKREETKMLMMSGKRGHVIKETEVRKNGNNSSSLAQGSTRGKGTEQLPKIDFSAEATQQSSEQKKPEVFYTRKGKKRGVSDGNYKKDLNVGVEGTCDVAFHGQEGKTKTAKQLRKDGPILEENEPGEQLAVAARSGQSILGDILKYHVQGNRLKTESTRYKYSRKIRSNHVTSDRAL